MILEKKHLYSLSKKIIIDAEIDNNDDKIPLYFDVYYDTDNSLSSTMNLEESCLARTVKIINYSGNENIFELNEDGYIDCENDNGIYMVNKLDRSNALKSLFDIGVNTSSVPVVFQIKDKCYLMNDFYFYKNNEVTPETYEISFCKFVEFVNEYCYYNYNNTNKKKNILQKIKLFNLGN